MSANSKIEWCDHTFNPWIGCTKISPACDHCYAERSTPSRTLGVSWGPLAERRRTSPANWLLPMRLNAQHGAFLATHGRRQRVFCASLADVFDNAVPTAWRIDLLDLIYRTPHLDWLLLTKRIGNAQGMLNEAARNLVGGPPSWWSADAWPNVWLGATVCDQAEADRDLPKLLATPARVRFVSMEPLLGPVNLWPMLKLHMNKGVDRDPLDWVIVGGESGPGARPMHPDWARGLRDQCAAAGVPFLFKQWGEFASVNIRRDEFLAPLPQHLGERIAAPGGELAAAPHASRVDVMRRVGKKAAGRHLDGREWNGAPA